MRIMIVTDHYPPTIGGVPTVTHGLAHDFADRGHQVWVVAPSQGPRDERRLEHQVRVYRFSSFEWPAYKALDRKSTRLNSSHANISTLSLHDALPISYYDRY